MKPSQSGLIIIGVGASLLAGCATVPKLAPSPQMRSVATLETTRSFQAPAAAWPDQNWWAPYGDPQIDRLMAEALAGSPSMEVAVARLRAAEAQVRQVPGSPSLSGNVEGEANIAKQSTNIGIPPGLFPDTVHSTGRVELNLTLDLDLWGRNRAALAAATSEAQAARVDVEQARLLLTTSLAQAYVDFARILIGRDLAQSALDIRQGTLRLMQDRVKAGLNPPADAAQAASAEQAARAALAGVDEEIARDRNRIAALVGAGPDRGLSLTRPPIAMARGFGAPQDLALELLGRRPDIVSARLRAEAAASRIKEARAAFYPNVNLAAVIGLQSFGITNLLKRRSIYGNVGPAISLPIFNQGSVGGRYAEARARYDEAVGNYNQTLITGLREVADALAGKRALVDRLTAERAALAQAEAAYTAARKRYEAGLSNRLELLSAEDALLPRRQAVADLEARAFTLDIDLIRALGGGFTSNGQPS